MVTTTAFPSGGAIPASFTCDGLDVSPDISWTPAAVGVAEYAVVMIDFDANDFIHWLVYGIPSSVTAIPRNALPAGARVGKNSFGSTGYRGPCPPRGPTHEYTIVVFGLRRVTGLREGATFAQLDKIQSVLDKGFVTGTYSRS